MPISTNIYDISASAEFINEELTVSVDSGQLVDIDVNNPYTIAYLTPIIISDTAPEGYAPGSILWFNPTDSFLRIEYNDGVSTQWIKVYGDISAATISSKIPRTSISLSGTEVELNYSTYNIDRILEKKVILDSTGESVEVVFIHSTTSIIIQSNIDLTGHSLVIDYIE